MVSVRTLKNARPPIISLTSDFAVQSQGVGIMEGVVAKIAPRARVIHLMHGLPDFSITAGARTMETVRYLPVGFHVCVVDPGVGTKRRGIIIVTKRGDYLIGPDNGVLVPATEALGGCKKVVEITNPKYRLHPVSKIFHGRDVFTPAAAYLANGVKMEEFGKQLSFEQLVKAPYNEAVVKDNKIIAEVIHINKYGSPHLNISHSLWDRWQVKKGQTIEIKIKKAPIKVPFVETFGDVLKGRPLILKDDYVRIQLAINQGNFTKKYRLKTGDQIILRKKDANA